LVKLAPIPPIHDIAATNVKPFKSVVGQNYTTKIDLTVENQGDFTEAFNVTLYVNTTTIETKQITLTHGESAILTFTWDTSDFTKGNYTLSAYAEPVQGETDTSDNALTVGVVTLTIAGDLDGNFKVQLADLVILAKAYGSKPAEPKWNANADIDNNDIVGLSDLVILAKNYGKTDP
jgi:hypothetical protein